MSNLKDTAGKGIKDSVSYRIIEPEPSKTKCLIPGCNKEATHRCIGQFLYCKRHLDEVRMFFSDNTIEEL